VVKLLSRRWWIPIGARLEGPNSRPKGREQSWGSRPPTRGFQAFKAFCLAFMAFKQCLMLGFYPAEWWIPEKVPDLNVRYRISY